MKFLIAFVLSFLIIQLINAVNYLRRIAEALEDLVYEDEEDTKESEANNG